MARQSFPFTYIYFDLQSNDGQPHNVQLYLDISGGTSIAAIQIMLTNLAIEWISHESENTMTYQTSKPSESSPVVYHYAQRLERQRFNEVNGTAEDATMYFGMTYVSCCFRSVSMFVR